MSACCQKLLVTKIIRDKLQNDESLDESICLSPECITGSALGQLYLL